MFNAFLFLTIKSYRFFYFSGRHNFANRAALIIHSIIICGAIFVLVYIAIEVPLVSYPSMQFCALYHRIKTLTFIPAVACFYFALWLRIYVLFYKNSLIKINTGKLMYYVNISSLPLLIIMMSSNMLLFLDIPTNGFAGCGCKEDRSKKTAAKWAFLFLSTTIFQAVMLISFANPLYLHHRKMLKRGCGRRPLWILLIKRASFVASVCFISDLANFIFAATYVGETTYVKHVVFSCNLLVNLAGTILSYASWRERIFPFKLNFSKIKVVAR